MIVQTPGRSAHFRVALCPVLDEGGDAGDTFADHKLVDIVRAFVGVDRFEIVHVAHDHAVVHDAVCAQDFPGEAGGFACHPDTVHFEHGDVRWMDPAEVL